MYPYTIVFSVLAILGGAQAARPRGKCHARPQRPDIETLAAGSSGAEVTSSIVSEVMVPILPIPTSSPEVTASDMSTTEVMTTVTETLASLSNVPSEASTEPAAEAATTSSVSPTEEAATSVPPSPAEPSVVSTPASSESAPATRSTIDVNLAATAAPTTSTAAAEPVVPAETSSTAPTVAGDHRVGLGVNGETGPLSSFVGDGSKLGWYYNWALDANADSAGLEYVPMVWGNESVSKVQAASEKWQGVSYVLGFNEPDQLVEFGGCDLDPGLAAVLHKQWVGSLGGSSSVYQIGSPAVAQGGKDWMNDWLVACQNECHYDFVPFHFYGTDVNALMDYVMEFTETFRKPLWLTEWSCHDYITGEVCDQGEVEQFMKTAVAYFRSSGLVERWAWFGAFPDMASGGDPNGLQNADGSVNQMGSLYLQL